MNFYENLQDEIENTFDPLIESFCNEYYGENCFNRLSVEVVNYSWVDTVSFDVLDRYYDKIGRFSLPIDPFLSGDVSQVKQLAVNQLKKEEELSKKEEEELSKKKEDKKYREFLKLKREFEPEKND